MTAANTQREPPALVLPRFIALSLSRLTLFLSLSVHLSLRTDYHKSRSNRIIIFVLYKKEAVRVENLIRSKGYAVGGIHGDKNQSGTSVVSSMRLLTLSPLSNRIIILVQTNRNSGCVNLLFVLLAFYFCVPSKQAWCGLSI